MDLSTSFHPVPKPPKRRKKMNRLRKIGKTGRDNLSINAELRKQFQEAGIFECELMWPGCWKNTTLTFAHDDKRRFLTKEEKRDIHHVALLCTPCHMKIEVLSRAAMKLTIQKIVERRN